VRPANLFSGLLAIAILQATLSACAKEPAVEDVPPHENAAGQTEAPPDEVAAELASDVAASPDHLDMLPEELQRVWQPWIGDFEQMAERRVIRAAVPYGGYDFYYQEGRPRGATYDLLQHLESHINAMLSRRHIIIHIVAIPVSRDRLLPALADGNVDLVAGDLTMTEQRRQDFAFSRPLRTKINEVLVTGPASPQIDSLDDLSGQEVFVRPSSSYYEHLEARGIAGLTLVPADELLEAEDILEMLNAGMIEMTVMDDYKAEFWAQVFPDIVVRNDLALSESGSLGWAMRKDSPELLETVNEFLRQYGKGTLVGNDTYNRYLASASRVRCGNTPRAYANLLDLVSSFKKYGEEYGFDWEMLAAQAYQESGFRQSRKSPAGAIGIMQIKPSTAADRHVGIDDITTTESNIHAGTKYLRFIADRYFNKPEIDRTNQWLLSLSAYNAGPAKINRYRREAAEAGYDPNLWFDNVEIIAARRIGRETVSYVSNIFKYYLGYQIATERGAIRSERFASELSGCDTDIVD
jgi:membrane-bound lytic murein transglycosylase MltF